MRFSINTEKIQALVTDVAKGVGNNKIMPITSMIGVKFNDGVLYLTSFNGTTLFRVSSDIGKTNKKEYGEVTVNADMFIGLISKLSDCSEIDFETDNGIFVVAGYKGEKEVGQYKLELILDDKGDVLKYVDMEEKIKLTDGGSEYDLSVGLVEEIITSCKQALATDVGESCYTNYLVSNKIISTDRTRAVFVDEDIAGDKPHFLLNRKFVDLLALMQEEVKLIVSDNGMYATDNHGTEVFTSFNGNVGDFNEKAMDAMLKMKFPSMCMINKAELLNTLNRMSLFCNKYDNNGIDITFGEESLSISSLKNSAVDEIEYKEFKDVEQGEICIDVTLLLPHIKAYTSDTIELHFGNPKCIKLVDGYVTQIIALVNKTKS